MIPSMAMILNTIYTLMTPQYFSAAMNFPLASKLIVNYLLDIFTLIPNRYLRSKLSVLDPGPWRRFWDRSLTDTPPHCQWSPIFLPPWLQDFPFPILPIGISAPAFPPHNSCLKSNLNITFWKIFLNYLLHPLPHRQNFSLQTCDMIQLSFHCSHCG